MEQLYDNISAKDPAEEAKLEKLQRIKDLQIQHAPEVSPKTSFPWWVGLLVFVVIVTPLSVFGVILATKKSAVDNSVSTTDTLKGTPAVTPTQKKVVIEHGFIRQISKDMVVEADFALIDQDEQVVAYLKESTEMKDLSGFLDWEADVKGTVVGNFEQKPILEVQGIVF